MSDYDAGSQRKTGSWRKLPAALAPVLAAAWPQMAAAAPGDTIEIGGGASLDPILAARLRHEVVDQAGAPDEARALTLRVRAGAAFKVDDFTILAEGEGTAVLVDDYNDTLPGNGVEPFPVVADPENVELNRLQVSWMRDGTGVTVGRQRIILDDARFVGNVGWRQNEQTFDAVRGQAKVGPVSLDATYANSQRTIFGADSPNAHFDGDLVLLNGGVDLAAVEAKAFAYLIDYDTRLAFSSQTYGVRVGGGIAIPAVGKLEAQASYARQSDYGSNPVAYDADYWNAQLGLSVFGFDLKAGYEELGSDGGTAAIQTPLATLHAFNGWADVFLTTPAAGLRDHYVTVGRAIGVPFLPGLKAGLTYHEFDSAFGGLDYGHEWDASLGFTLGPAALLAKYANYQADGFAVDTEKFWLQAEIGF
ncbi:alginate export family protein [Pelagerythrobacter marensis]|uniref:Alginate export family protein n=1 Tax=Pelagerythrobacter marensis TaxID=543877 RepID=A0ABZ2D2U2_9SPHN